MTTVIGIAISGCALGSLSACSDRAVSIQPEMGLELRDTKRGFGPVAKEGSHVVTHYVVALPDGTIVIDTRANKQSHRWIVGDGTVIEGMDLAVRGMRSGGVRDAIVPPRMHYGRPGHADVIPPETPLHIHIEMLSVTM